MPDRTTPISDHADVTREQLAELVERMKADGRIPAITQQTADSWQNGWITGWNACRAKIVGDA